MSPSIAAPREERAFAKTVLPPPRMEYEGAAGRFQPHRGRGEGNILRGSVAFWVFTCAKSEKLL